ncbi:MAG: diadenylate cyclase CdaA [Planctomycetota bacterium]
MFFDDVLNLNGLLIALRSYTWWKVALELLVIGVVVFWVIRFLQDTRGARLLKGILLVLISGYIIVRILDRSFELITLGYLYSRFLLFAGAAIVVVFQPELRRALMRLGETRLFASRSNADARVEALVEAASFCAKRKIGALIAVEREVALAGTAENATKLDAELTSQLLNTIFWPNSPLHDLGVVISKGRVMFAGVQFPLAESGELERDLGSRHRAAVGMSQDSDALVIVVSEETGQISLAQYGKLNRKLKPDVLRSMLERGLNDDDPDDAGFSDTDGEPDDDAPKTLASKSETAKSDDTKSGETKSAA